jgi:hypothetical protein
MSIELSPETQKLVEEQMRRFGLATPEELIRVALEQMDQPAFGDDDPETMAAIEEGEAQLDRGEGRPWDQFRAELSKKLLGE